MEKATKIQNSDPLKSLRSSIAFYVGKITENENGVTEIKETIQEMKTHLANMDTTLQNLTTELTNTQTQVGSDQNNTKAEIQALKIHEFETKIKQINKEITALKSCACPDSWKTQTNPYKIATTNDLQPTVLPAGPGTGTMQDPYKIATVNDLQKLRTVWGSNTGKYFIVTQDIDLSSIANFTSLPDFNGTLDGNNKKILNLRIDRYYASLFQQIGQGGVVKNLGFENVAIKGNRGAAALATYNYGTVDNCYVTGQVSCSAKYGHSGGLVLYSSTGSIIKNSYSTARVSGSYYSGGLVAVMNKATVENSYSSGSVSTVDSGAGGLVASMTGGVIRQSYATGSVSGKYVVGGLVGLVNNPESIIENSYSSGSVSALGMAGGLVGNLSGKIKNSYSSGSVVSKQSRVNRLGVLAGEYGSEGTIIKSFGKSQSGVSNTRGQKTDAELKDPSTFSSWDKNIWKIESGKYPKLKVFLN
ncbi:unnamed protein product [Porites evermanni]|uniref:GLUG domain-containing protein n=1 Tax=Porites evermanni TaxID=104178 RepID=A0ABN8M6T7_9CNID|nr:unnamed protein product [Porites evermanni]